MPSTLVRWRLSLSFYLYTILLNLSSVVGGGFFTGRYTSMDSKAEPGSRFDPDQMQGKVSRSVLQNR